MTSNTRVVVTGAGLAGVRSARRLGESGMPVTPVTPLRPVTPAPVPVPTPPETPAAPVTATGPVTSAGSVTSAGFFAGGVPPLHLLTHDGGS
ncbi:hypothetical protein ABZ646_32415 [Streptomyces sp. NPDC007162]|uniref:hypothetical protein n=1 Tax=Streptomyces sp. NPDC007162 TaxID=3156917 RepID=UPI0033FAA302